MLKKLNRMWLSGIRKAGKAQQARATKVLKAMLKKPKAPPRAAPTKSASATKTIARPSNRTANQVLPGIWTNAYHTLVTHAVPTVHRMRYWLHIPSAKTRPASGSPLLVMLHGCEQNAVDFATGTRMNKLAGEKGYLVLYPQQSLRAHPNRCWKWYDPVTQRGGGDVEMIADMIRAIANDYAIDQRRIYVCGISAGAAMAQILALTHPELIAAVGMHSGPAFGVSRNAMGAYGVMQHGGVNPEHPIARIMAKMPAFPPMPAILFTGDDDKIVRPVNQDQLLRQFLRLNHAADLKPLPAVVKEFGRVSKAFPRKNAMRVIDYVAGNKVLVRSVHIARLGHAWSGGDDSLAFHANGPDASKLMLAFFSRHRRDA